MNTKKFLNTVIATFSTEVGIHILNLLSTIIIVRNLSTYDFGIYSLIISFSFTLCYLSSIGLPQAIIFFIGKEKEPEKILISIYLFLFFCFGICTVIIAFLCKDYLLNSFLHEIPKNYFPLLLIIYFFTLFDAFLLSIIRGKKNFLLFNVRKILTPAGNLSGIVFLYLIASINLKNVVLISMGITVILTLWFFFKVIPKSYYKFNYNWNIIKSLLGYGIKSYIQAISGHLIYQIDLYIIAYILNAREVAFYSIAVGMATLLWYIPNTVGTVLFPSLSSLNDEKNIHLVSALINRNTLFITFLSSLVMGFTGKYLISFFYGDHYNSSVNAMIYLLPGIVMMSSYKILTRNFSSRNRQQISIISATTAFIVNVGLNFILIPEYGIEGAAIASTISYILAGIILIVIFKGDSNLSFREILLVEKTDIKFYLTMISRFKNHKNCNKTS